MYSFSVVSVWELLGLFYQLLVKFAADMAYLQQPQSLISQVFSKLDFHYWLGIFQLYHQAETLVLCSKKITNILLCLITYRVNLHHVLRLSIPLN